VKVGRFLLARLIAGLAGLLVFTTLMWVGFALLVPADFSANFAQGASAEQLAAIRAELGLDRPWHTQYVEFLGSVARLEFGHAYFGPPVRDILIETLPWTLTLFFLAMALALVIGLPLGRRAGWADHRLSPTLVAAAAATSIFPPWLALMIANVGFGLIGVTLYDRLRNLDEVMWDTGPDAATVLWLLVGGIVVAFALSVLLRRQAGLARFVWLHRAATPITFSALVGVIWLSGLLPRSADLLGYLTMPLAAFSLTMTGEVILVVAAAMTGTRTAPYTESARAKGLTEAAIRKRHAGRATLLPAISRMAVSLPYTLGGLMIVEAAFAQVGARGVPVPGLSSTLLMGFQQRNTPVVVGAVVAVGLVSLVVRLCVDLLHVVLDPRIEVEPAVA
jgi:peptide/nickel transport system permease protein